jgi:hypothetical protein
MRIVTGSMYENGSRGLQIGTMMMPEEAYGRAGYLAWSNQDPALAVHYKFTRGRWLTADQGLGSLGGSL